MPIADDKATQFLAGKDEMKMRFRQLDWAATGLGPSDSWPQSLKTAVGIMLNSQFPMFISWGKDRTFLYNSAYAPILGEKHPSALGRTFYENWQEIWSDIFPLIEKVDQGEALYLEDLRLIMHRHRQGTLEETFFTFSYSPLRNESDEVAGLFCAVVETTARKKLEEVLTSEQERLRTLSIQSERERAKFEAAFNAVAEGIFIFDSTGQPVFMNDGAAKVFGSKEASDVTKDFTYFFERLDLYEMDGTYVPIEEWPVSKVLRGESFRDWQLIAHRRDIDKRWIWSSSGELAIQAESDITLAVVVLRDITDQKTSEQELVNAKTEADRANQLKSSFLANMSHEIRTPLGAMLGFSSLLKDRDLAQDERDQYVDTIIRNGNALTGIIDDILDLAKVEAGKLTVEKIDVAIYDLMSDAVELFRDKAKQKGLYLLLTIDETVPQRLHTDPTRLRQILVNLIGNAIKFTEEGGVRVNVSSEKIGLNEVRMNIEVRDTGVGLSEEQQIKLFQPFTQADNSTTRKFGGTGLGLVLSQRLALALNGKITINTSTVGGGSSFGVSFETTVYQHPPQQRRAEALPPNESLDGLKILVVDDSPDNQHLIKRMLTKRGAQIWIASDGREGFEAAVSGSFDIVLMDLQMPNMDGYQAKQALDQRGYRKPVIALTAHAMAEEKTKTRAAGFAGHLTKPIAIHAVTKMILEFVPRTDG